MWPGVLLPRLAARSLFVVCRSCNAHSHRNAPGAGSHEAFLSRPFRARDLPPVIDRRHTPPLRLPGWHCPGVGGGQREASGDLPDWGEPAIQSAFPVSFCLALAHLAISLENLPVAEEAIIQALFFTAGLNRLCGGKDTYFCLAPLLKPNESKRERTRVLSRSRLFRSALAQQAASANPCLTLAMPTAIALSATFLVDHRVTAALGAEIACHA